MAEKGSAKGGLLGNVDSEVTDRLKEEFRNYAIAQGERVLTGFGRRLGASTAKLDDIAQGRSPGFARLIADGGRKLADGKGPVRSAVELGASRLKDNATDAIKNVVGGKRGRKGGGGQKPTVIMESVDVGVPVREAYNQWTRYQDFPTFARGVKSASSADDTSSDWNMKVFWSSRSWKARTTEQIPDSRICWTSEGAKGTTKGVVTFHPLGENLTRVLLVVEYYPKGLFEKTGNIWRAQGRRMRLDLKNFARHISIRGEADEGWRGEISDGEVVRTHEDVVAEEENEADGSEETYEDEDGYADEADGSEDEDGYADEAQTPDEAYEDEEQAEPQGEYDEAGEEAVDEDRPADEDDEAEAVHDDEPVEDGQEPDETGPEAEEEYEEEYEDPEAEDPEAEDPEAYEEEPEPARQGAGSGRGR